jgi:tRNA1(Val) A37 N6-methylase TrmN6
MSETKSKRIRKKQLGQFMTPIEKCQYILSNYKFTITDKILEPSFGCGNFIITLIDKFLPLYEGTIEEKIKKILNINIWGVEYDSELYQSCINKIKSKWGFIPETHNLVLSDYLLYNNAEKFNYIIGNPPFGGTINPGYSDEMDKKFGMRNGYKIKKETYSFFIIKSIESLDTNGKLIFISSDTFLTIKTMVGLRMYLYNSGLNSIELLQDFSDETKYPMVVLLHHKSNSKDYIIVDNVKISYKDMCLTENFSWNIKNEFICYFNGETLGKYITATGGLTIGKNELFLREINSDNTIVEEYEFEYFNDIVTLEGEISKSKNGNISAKRITSIENGEIRRNVKITKRKYPIHISLPDKNYCYYNKSSSDILWANPKTVVYWKDDGDAVITFKKNGNWYLHGVGSKTFFKKEGITWQLISSSIKPRYLPTGYIIDPSSPLAVLKDGINNNELFFIIGWLLTDKCNKILKTVINHTKNIQGKDIERLPYPFWVSIKNKLTIIKLVKESIEIKKVEGYIPENLQKSLCELFNINQY